MSSATTALPPIDDDAIAQALALLLDVGTALAAELKSPAPDVTVADRARAFDGVARAVRQTILLSRHLAEHRPAADTAVAARAQARREVIRGVENAIDHVDDPKAAETLRRELRERMERPELDFDLLTRKPAQVVTEILRDLGLPNNTGYVGPRRSPADIARLCAQAAAPANTNLDRALRRLKEN